MKALKTIINIILCLGLFLVFNESDTIIPNLIGLACFGLLIAFNADKETLEKIK